MGSENRIYVVKEASVEGFLSDHYNPVNKMVNLSPDVYNGINISAEAGATHESDHPVQNVAGYVPLMFRSKMVVAVQVSIMLVNWILLAGIVILATTGSLVVLLLLIDIIVMSITVLFTLITLQVEFDAS